MRKRNYKNVYLFDLPLLEAIENLDISNIRKEGARYLVWILLRDGRRFNQDAFSFTDKPKNFLAKVFSSRYKEILNPLIEGGIIEVDNSYSADLHFSKRYKVANKFCPKKEVVVESNGNLNTISSCDNGAGYVMCPQIVELIDFEQLNLLKMEVHNNTKKAIKYMDIIEDVEKNLAKLKIDYLKLEDTLRGYFNTITPASFKTNHEVKRKVVEFEEGVYLTKQQALDKLLGTGLTMIEDYDGKVYFRDLIKFVNDKRESVFVSYKESILGMEHKYFFASRNDTNNRLDTNLTNLPSLLLEVIKEDNGLVEIDLCNSQFAIFAHLIPKEVAGDDVELFKKLSQECELYPYLQEKMALSSRKEAKTVCFEVCFSSHKNHSQYVTEMRKLFPNVMRWVDNFKEKHGDNQFAIMLQKKEAEIFIDNLYVMIREEDIFCLTKHDSLIVKAEDEYKVRNIIEEYFKEINFKAIIR